MANTKKDEDFKEKKEEIVEDSSAVTNNEESNQSLIENPIVNKDEQSNDVTNKEKKEEEEGDTENVEISAQIVFPPHINWNGIHAAASRSEMFAYLAGSVIIVAKIDNNNTKQLGSSKHGKHSGGFLGTEHQPVWPKFLTMGAQKDPYTSICCSQQEWDLLPIKDSPLVTGDSMGFVKMWNIEQKIHPTYHSAHKPNAVMDVTWSPRDPNLVYSVDNAGLVTIWNIREKSLKTNHYDRPGISCISVSPYEDHIIAVGFQSGSILIVDTSSQMGEILYKMNHSCDLISLSWVPKEFEKYITLEAHHKTPLLISSVHTVEDATIRVWDREGHDVNILSLGEKNENIDAGASQLPPARSVQRKQYKTFVPTAWIKDPSTEEPILFSSFKNNIVYWKNLTDPFTVLHDIHRIGSIFCMIQTDDILWSFGSESMIVGYNLRTSEKDVIAPTFNGICNLHSSPVIRTQVTFGGGDGVIRVINMTPGFPQQGPYESPILTGRIHDAKITAVCWHPIKDNLIGLGTNEGVLGVFEYRDNNRFARRCVKRVNGTIYGLDWGPHTYTKFHEETRKEKYGTKKTEGGGDGDGENQSGDKEPMKNNNNNNLMLYACGGNGIHMINPIHSSASLINVGSHKGSIIYQTNLTEDKTSRGSSRATDIRWCPDRQLLCVGYVDGRIDIYTAPYLKLRCSIKCHTRDIQHLTWRPYDFGPETDSLSKWFASSSNDGTIRLYNLAELYSTKKPQATTTTTNGSEDKIHLIRQSATTLNGHNGIRVISLNWSPHDPKLLVSVSYDRSAVVWNIIDGTPLARYCGHFRRLVGCMFHPSHKYQVITCSDEVVNDFCLHVWDYRDFPYKEVSDRIITQVTNMKQAIKAERIEKEQEPVRLGKFTYVEKGTVYECDSVMTTNEESETSTTNSTTTTTGNHNNLIVFTHSNTTGENALLPLASTLLNKEPTPKVGIQEEIMSLIQLVDKNLELNNVNNTVYNKEQKKKEEQVDPSLKKLVLNIGLGKDADDSDGDESEDSDDDDGDNYRNIDGSDSDEEDEENNEEEQGFKKFITSEIENHIADGRWKNAMHLSSWTGNHSQIVEMALKKNELCESVIKTVLANPYDAKFRCKVISAYAKKLESQNDIPGAVENLLLIGHDEEAIDLYRSKKYYHEAFALTKIRLIGPVKEEKMKQIHDDWATDLVEQGKYLQALRMFCSTKQYFKALEVLELWNTSEAWELGLYIASLKSTDEVYANKYGDYFGMKFIEDALANQKYEKCLETIKTNTFLNWLLPIVTMHQQLSVSLSGDEKGENTLSDNNNFAQSVLDAWISNGITPEIYESTKEKILALLKVVIPQNKNEALFVIARYMSLILLDSEDILKWNSDSQPIIKLWFPNASESNTVETCLSSLTTLISKEPNDKTQQDQLKIQEILNTDHEEGKGEKAEQ